MNNTGWMMRRYLWTLACLMLFTGCLANDAIEFADCKQYVKGQDCRLELDFNVPSGHSYAIQAWDRDSLSWMKIQSTKSLDSLSDAKIAQGSLNMVLACDAKERNCVSSYVFWSPDWTSVENIPDSVEFTSGGNVRRYSIVKTDEQGLLLGPATITVQYNMILLKRELANIAMSNSDFPPMVRQEYPDEKGLPITLEEQVTDNVFMVYEETRLALEKYRVTGR